MAQVEILVNDRAYRVSCQDGQEERLLRLAAHLDRETRALAGDLGQIGEARMLLLAALTVCDELFEVKDKLQELETKAQPLDSATVGGATRVVDAAAKRIEGMVDRLSA